MRSKISYFNPTLFKKNLTRFWPLWGGTSAVGALAPLYLLVAYLNRGMGSVVGKGLEMTRMYYSVLQYVVPIASLFYAALCALAVWHYLYNARSLGLYHALPITRKGLFATNFLSGMAMMLIPYAVTGGLAILLTLFIGMFEPVGVLVTILGVLGESFFYFAAATCIVFVTGNPFAFAAFYFIFHFLAAGAEYLVAMLTELFYFGVSMSYEGVVMFLSPTLFLASDSLGIDTTWREVVTAEGWRNIELESVTLTGGWVIAVYALAGAALLVCAWLLYSRRRSESAGDVVAVGWMKPIFRYGVALCAAVAGGVLLYGIFCKDFIESDTARPLPMAVCMAIAGIVGYYIASMLLAKSLAVFRGSGKGALATVIAAAAVCFLIAADPFGVERWVPDAAELEGNVGFSVWGMANGLNVDVSDPATVQKLLDLHRTVLAEKKLLDDRDRDPEFWGYGYGSMELHYETGGKYVWRSYRIPVSKAALSRLETIQKIAELAVDPVIQEANIFGQIAPERVTSARPTGGYIRTLYNTEIGLENVDLTAEQTAALEDAIRRDIQAGHFGRTVFVTDYEERDRLTYAGSIELHYNVARPQEYANYSNNVDVHLEISVYCTETVKALEEMGVLNGRRRLLTVAENDSRRESGNYSYGYLENTEWVY